MFKNAMKFRNVSIGVSSCVSLGIVGFWFFADHFSLSDVPFILVLGVMSALPQIISIMISAYSNRFFIHIGTMSVSLFHGFFFAYYCTRLFYTGLGTPLVLPLLWFFLLPVLLPLGFIAIVIEKRRKRKE